jgi:hypothetical protein
MLDRNSGQPVGELARDRVGRGHSLLLRVQPPEGLLATDRELGGILVCIFS